MASPVLDTNKSFSKDGWRTVSSSDDRSYIYSYNKNNPNGDVDDYRVSSPNHWSWGMKGVWDSQEVAIEFFNSTDQIMKISKVSIKAHACDSGGKGYYVWGSNSPSAVCLGYGAKYYAYVRVYNPTTKQFTDTSIIKSVDIPNIGKAYALSTGTSYSGTGNMDSPGSGPWKTASFGTAAYYPGLPNEEYGRPVERWYEISQCPEIKPGYSAFLHFGVTDWKSPKGETRCQVRFLLDPRMMNIVYEPENTGYIWVYENKKWHLRKPAFTMTSEGWKNVEGDEE